MTENILQTVRWTEVDDPVVTGFPDTKDWIMPDADIDPVQVHRDVVESALPLLRNGSASFMRSDTTPKWEILEALQFQKHVIAKTKRSARGTLIQQWECLVNEINDRFAVCEMHDLTDPSQEIEIAEVYLDEFSEPDRRVLSEGSVFYWSVGREVFDTGRVRRFSEIRVRRLPQLSKSKKRAIAEKVDDAWKLFQKG